MAENSYCEAIRLGRLPEVHIDYHNHAYGFPIREDAALLERLVLEINQAGLSWTTILRKQHAFQEAFAGFDPDRVAAFNDEDVARLLSNPAIIRNRLKVNAAIENARRVQTLRAGFGSFAAWLDHHHPLPKEQWVKLFKQTFVFTGGEIVNEFLMSTGYLPGAHQATCPVYAEVARQNPPWLAAKPDENS